MADGIESICCSDRSADCFRYEQGVSLAVISLGPFRKVVEVDIGREEIQSRGSGAPEIERMRQRPPAVVLAWLIIRSNQSGIREHRQRILCFSGRSNIVDVARILPGHEQVFRDWAFAEDILPCACIFVSGGIPDRAKLGAERWFALPKV